MTRAAIYRKPVTLAPVDIPIPPPPPEITRATPIPVVGEGRLNPKADYAVPTPPRGYALANWKATK